MRIVDTKEFIDLKGKLYQVKSIKSNSLIGGATIEFRQIIPIPILKISIELNHCLFYYKPYVKTMPYSGNKIGREGEYMSIIWQTPELITNINLQKELICEFKEIKNSSNTYQFINQSINK